MSIFMIRELPNVYTLIAKRSISSVYNEWIINTVCVCI